MLEGNCRGKFVVICSDIQAALLDQRRCFGAGIRELSRANPVSLLWVPGHSSVVGNNKAERLDNRGTRYTRATLFRVELPEC